MSDRPEPRSTCYTCFKPSDTCVCGTITQVDNATGVFVLQHPREWAHPIGTARFVELGLKRSKVIVARTAARDLHAPLALPPRTALLYPRSDARDLETLPTAERPDHLLVLDGTWAHARTLYRRNPWLEALPHVRLSPETPSRYRIRREPRPDFLSTLESVLLALRVLEPDLEGLPGLLGAFDTMVDAQIAHTAHARRAGAGGRRRRLQPARRFAGLPRWLGEAYGRAIGVYAEAMPARGRARGPRSLLQLSAVRWSTGEVFERLVVPQDGLPGEAELASLGLRPGDFDGAVDGAALARDFAAFIGKDPCVAWNGSTPSLIRDATGQSHRLFLMMPVVREIELRLGATRGEGPRSLDERSRVVAVSGDAASPPAVRGRAADRLANLHQMAEWARATRVGGPHRPERSG